MFIIPLLLYTDKFDPRCTSAPATQTYTNDWTADKNNCGTYTKVIISSEVTSIIDSAFLDCDKIETIKFNQKLQTIGSKSFQNLEILKEVIFPDTLISIGSNAFQGCSSLKTVKLSNSLTTLGDAAFEECLAITSLTIPKSLKQIGAHVFGNLESISSSLILEDGLTVLGDYMFENSESISSITFPDSITKINDYCFQSCINLATVTFSENLESIGQFAFYLCRKLTTLNLPKSLKTIDYNAFQKCTGLTSITLPENVKTINDYAFTNIKKLTEITIRCKKLDYLGTFLKKDPFGGLSSENVNKIVFYSNEFKFLKDQQLMSSVKTIVFDSDTINYFPDITKFTSLQYLYINKSSPSLYIYENCLPKITSRSGLNLIISCKIGNISDDALTGITLKTFSYCGNNNLGDNFLKNANSVTTIIKSNESEVNQIGGLNATNETDSCEVVEEMTPTPTPSNEATIQATNKATIQATIEGTPGSFQREAELEKKKKIAIGVSVTIVALVLIGIVSFIVIKKYSQNKSLEEPLEDEQPAL